MFAITVIGVFCVIELCGANNSQTATDFRIVVEATTSTVSPDGPDLLDDHLTEEKAAHKSGEMYDLGLPVTMDKIKAKLKDLGIFDSEDNTLTEREKKELNKLFNAVEIMTTSRARQPNSAQNVFSALRVVERAVKKQLKGGQISDTLASKFDWDKISQRPRREKPFYYIDRSTNMRVFDTD